jgi:putative glutamine amidotransferase
MLRIVVSYSNAEKAEKYKDTLKGTGGRDVEILDAFAGAGVADGDWRSLMGNADALVLTGGPDVAPSRYGAALDDTAGVETIHARDAMEWELLAAARAARQPVLGICRGHQVVNAFLGGTLWQDLGALGPEVRQAHDPAHDDRTRLAHAVAAGTADTPFCELLGSAGRLVVNSLHHQGVREVGPGLIVAATSPDGVVEALESADPAWWLWSVQWHPEELVGADQHPLPRTLFERSLGAARAAAERRRGAGAVAPGGSP